jgi:hypothetical protein
MKSRNVIITLLFVLALLVLTVIKIRFWEPQKKVSFRRNPSRIEYTEFAICRMGCYGFSANMITSVFRHGHFKSGKQKDNCYYFTVNMLTKQGMSIFVKVRQCGTVARILDCYETNTRKPCNCIDKESPPVL